MRRVRLSDERVAELEVMADQKRLKWLARDISLETRQAICFEAERANVPSSKYKYQELLEKVIADLESFV